MTDIKVRTGDLGDDGAAWAKAFCEIWPGIDEGTMIGWFCNAIEISHDKRSAEATAERDRLREVNAELLAALKELSAGMWAGDGITNPAVPGEQVAKARAAIAKAEAQ